MTRVADGIYQLSVPIPPDALVHDASFGSTQVYLVEEPSGWVLIDAGWDSEEGWAGFLSQASEVVDRLSDIRTVVLTHAHPDHSGLAKRIAAVSGAEVVMHQGDAASFVPVPPMHGPTVDSLEGQLERSGAPDADRVALASFLERTWPFVMGLTVDYVLSKDEQIVPGTEALHALWTPGHSLGHLCLYDTYRKVLFSGDHVLPAACTRVGLVTGSQPNPLGDFLESLELVWRLDVGLVLPGHGPPFSGLLKRSAELFEEARETLAEIVQLCWDQPRNAYEIAAGLRRQSQSWRELPALTRLRALFQTLAYLRLLTLEGYVTEREEGRVIHYEAVNTGWASGDIWWVR